MTALKKKNVSDDIKLYFALARDNKLHLADKIKSFDELKRAEKRAQLKNQKVSKILKKLEK